MKLVFTIECQSCKKADAVVVASPTGSHNPAHEWKLCAACASEKTKYGPCWIKVKDLAPIYKDTKEGVTA